jgi:glycosyltransferase involved in cell wall biosynthesis
VNPDPGFDSHGRRAALVVDQFPLPPRNGITIPSAQILHWMQAGGYSVDIWLLGGNCPTAGQLHLASNYNIRVFTPRLKYINRVTRMLREIVGQSNAFDRWNLLAKTETCTSTYALTVSTPISVGLFAPSHLRADRHMVAINDSYYAVLMTHPFRPRVVELANRLRAPFLRMAEHAALEVFDDILVQTEADRDWLCGGPGARLRAQTHCLHNAVSDDMIELPYTGDQGSPRLLFVGDLSNVLYQQNLLKLHEVWRQVRRKVPDAVFQIAGSGLRSNSMLAKRLAADESVQILGFVPDILDVYRGVRAVVALIDKPYGFMNKVAEAIACGIPVIGDPDAFNGITAVLDMGGSVVARDAATFEREITSILTDDARVREMSTVCKSVAREQLSLMTFFASLDAILDRSGNSWAVR